MFSRIFAKFSPANPNKSKKHNPEFAYLITKTDISLDNLPDLSTEMELEFVRGGNNFLELINEANISLAKFINLKTEMRHELIRNSHGVAQLITEAAISLETLIELEEEIRLNLMEKSDAFIQLHTKAKISLETLIKLDAEIRSDLLRYPAVFIRLIMEANISLETLKGLTTEMRYELIRNNYGITQLINEAHIDLQTLQGFQTEMRNDLAEYWHIFIPLTQKALISFERLTALGHKRRYQFVQNQYEFKLLMQNTNVDLETLLNLEINMIHKLAETIRNSPRDIKNFNRVISEGRITYRYFIINQIITDQQLITSLVSPSLEPQKEFLAIKQLVDKSLAVSGILPDNYSITADNPTGLIKLVKGFAEIRKNARILSQNKSTLFDCLPNDIKAKIAGFTGNDKRDETCVAIKNYGKPRSKLQKYMVLK